MSLAETLQGYLCAVNELPEEPLSITLCVKGRYFSWHYYLAHGRDEAYVNQDTTMTKEAFATRLAEADTVALIVVYESLSLDTEYFRTRFSRQFSRSETSTDYKPQLIFQSNNT